MFTKIIISCFLLSSLLGFNPQRTSADDLVIKTIIDDQYIQEQVEYFSKEYGVDSKIIAKVIECESQGSPDVKGDGGRAYGLMQYHKSTFERHEDKLGEDLDYYSAYDQIKLGTWAIANGYGKEWSSYVAIMNGGTYKFYSSLMKEEVTQLLVNCSYTQVNSCLLFKNVIQLSGNRYYV